MGGILGLRTVRNMCTIKKKTTDSEIAFLRCVIVWRGLRFSGFKTQKYISSCQTCFRLDAEPHKDTRARTYM